MKIAIPQALRPLVAHMRPYRTHLLVLLGFAVAGLVFGVLRSSGSASAPDLNERWMLPQMVKADPVALSPDELVGSFWSEAPRAPKTKATAAPAKKATPWTFVGTVDQGGNLLAVIVLETGKTQRLKIGDSLPDGAMVIDIASGLLKFQREGTEGSVKLFLEKKPE